MQRKPIWAHHGESQAAPENTFPAYWAALGAGADGIMAGVQLSRDGHPVCMSGETLKATTGDDRRVQDVTLAELRRLDAGSQFRSRPLDTEHRYRGPPSETTPWVRNQEKRDAVHHPALDEAFLHLGRRTRFMLRLQPAGDPGPLVQAVLGLLGRNALLERTIIVGDAATLAEVGAEAGPRRVLVVGSMGLDDAASLARQQGIDAVLFDALRALGWSGSGLGLFVHPDEGYAAPSPHQHRLLVVQANLEGFVAPAVAETHAMANPRGVVAQDGFGGSEVNDVYWAIGNSKGNNDSMIFQDDGLHIRMHGDNYAGSAAFSVFSVHGDFEAQVGFTVTNPRQGTTFELAALHVDAGYHRPNLTFDVHGAPPYASSERDEDDGFRIGWNNGPALTRWRDGLPESSNLYNNYGRDVGQQSYEAGVAPSGALCLTRRGDVFNAYYRDEFHDTWVLSGTAAIPALGEAVFLRLGAKHWPKGGGPAPDNHVTFRDFKLEQW